MGNNRTDRAGSQDKTEKRRAEDIVHADNRVCPAARLSSPVKTNSGRDVIDVESYIPYFLVAVNNSLSRGASQYYLENFKIGIVEWRVVSMLAIEPDIAASRICEVISLDKAATSRALKQLAAKGYLEFDVSGTDARRKIWRLNDRGYALHDKILNVALEREGQLIAGTDPKDLEAFLRVMRIMRDNVDHIAVSGKAPS